MVWGVQPNTTWLVCHKNKTPCETLVVFTRIPFLQNDAQAESITSGDWEICGGQELHLKKMNVKMENVHQMGSENLIKYLKPPPKQFSGLLVKFYQNRKGMFVLYISANEKT